MGGAAGRGPRVTWLGRQPFYRPEAIHAWVLEQEREPSSCPPVDQQQPKRPRARREPAAKRPAGVRLCAIDGCAEPVDPKPGRPGPKPIYCPGHTTSKLGRRARP